MPDAVTFDIAGIGRLSTQLDAAVATLAPRVSQVVRASAVMLEAGGKSRCPVDTGALRSSISTATTGSPTDGMSAEVGPTQNYGGYVEFGTSRMRPQPYMIPALEAVEPQFVAAMEQLAATGLGRL